MAYEEQEAKRSRVVVDTPTSRREVVEHQAVRRPESSGVTATMFAVIIIGAIALATIIILFAMNQQDNSNLNSASQTAPPQTIVQQPAQQPPVVIQQPAPVGQPAPVIVTQPATGGAETTRASNDAAVQAAVDKRLSDDPVFSTLGVTATVSDGKATLVGTVKSQAQKAQIERAVRNVKGVKSIDNQIVVEST